jgi:hypothetical protein
MARTRVQWKLFGSPLGPCSSGFGLKAEEQSLKSYRTDFWGAVKSQTVNPHGLWSCGRRKHQQNKTLLKASLYFSNNLNRSSEKTLLPPLPPNLPLYLRQRPNTEKANVGRAPRRHPETSGSWVRPVHGCAPGR